ncbi:MAG: ROK family protein [Chloroflexi bacterium]|nr:ROK family protein [Chloroflexota bacterium]
MKELYLGIEIGGTKLQMVLGNLSGRIVERRRLTVNPKQGGQGIRRQVRTTLPALLSGARLLGVGTGFGGPVDWRRGRICCSHQVAGWSEFDLGHWLQKLTHAPVRVDNDANTAALGEARSGAGKNYNPVFYVTLGSGVGGGLVADGRIYHGATPGEAEIGHVRLDRQGTIVEARCSGWAVDARIRRMRLQEPQSALSRLAGDAAGGEARHLSAALKQGDPAARRVLRETAGDLAFGLSHVVHLIHPEIIVLGGGLSLVGEPLRAAVKAALRPLIMEAFLPGPRIALSALGEEAVPVGALHLAKEAEGSCS